MNKIITMCLLIIVLVVTGCGSSAGNGSGSPNNTPIIYNVTPNDSNSIANSVDANGNVAIKLTGVNFGSQNTGEVWYNGYVSENSSNAQPIGLALYYGGSWSDTEISVNLVKNTREYYPNGSFYVVANGQQSPVTARYNFGGGSLKEAKVTSISPNVIYDYDYNLNSRNVTITGSGFGSVAKQLSLFDMSSTSNFVNVTPYIWKDNEITFTVPSNFVNTSTTIGIKDYETGAMLGNTNTSQFRYVVFNPNITNVSPGYAYPGQSVTLYSSTGGFGVEKPSNAYIAINNCPVSDIQYWNDYNISFVIPENVSLAAGQATIQIQMYNKNITNNGLTLIPHITNITVYKSGTLLSTYYYTINGYCFDTNNPMIYVDNSPTINIISKTASSILISSSTDLAGRYIYMTYGNTSIQSNYCQLPSINTN